MSPGQALGSKHLFWPRPECPRGSSAPSAPHTARPRGGAPETQLVYKAAGGGSQDSDRSSIGAIRARPSAWPTGCCVSDDGDTPVVIPFWRVFIPLTPLSLAAAANSRL